MPTSRYVLVINSAAGSQAVTLSWSSIFAANGETPAGAPVEGGGDNVIETATGGPDAVTVSLVMQPVSIWGPRDGAVTRSARSV